MFHNGISQLSSQHLHSLASKWCLAHTNPYLITSGTKVFKSGQWEWRLQQEFWQFCQVLCWCCKKIQGSFPDYATDGYQPQLGLMLWQKVESDNDFIKVDVWNKFILSMPSWQPEWSDSIINLNLLSQVPKQDSSFSPKGKTNFHIHFLWMMIGEAHELFLRNYSQGWSLNGTMALYWKRLLWQSWGSINTIWGWTAREWGGE